MLWTLVFQAYMAFFLLFTLVYGGNNVYVDPIASSCSDFNCTRDASAPLVQNLTLDEALASITSQSTLHLRPGCHCIQSFNFVQNVSEVALVGEGPRSGVNITCAEGLGLAFYNLSSFSLTNITVDGCGLTGSNLSTFHFRVKSEIDLFFYVHSNSTIAVLCGNCLDLDIKNVTIKNTMGLGFFGINIMGNSAIRDSTFSHNASPAPLNPRAGSISAFQAYQPGGGALFVYHDYLDSTTFLDSITTFTIENSVFLGNQYPGVAGVIGINYQYFDTLRDAGYVLGGGGGLTLIMTQTGYAVSTDVNGCMFVENKAAFGGGAHVEFFAGAKGSNVVFSACLFDTNGPQIRNALTVFDADNGGALVLIRGLESPNSRQMSESLSSFQQDSCHFVVKDTSFKKNTASIGGAVSVVSYYSPLLKHHSDFVRFESCIFEDNSALLGAALLVLEDKRTGLQPGLDFLLENITMRWNKVYVQDSAQPRSSPSTDSSSIIDTTALNMTIRNGHFADNAATVLRSTLSLTHLEGNVTFFNNTGTFGGALRLLSSSFLVVRNNSNITFQDNTATISGGAIYVANFDSVLTVIYFDCFVFFNGINPYCSENRTCAQEVTETRTRLNFIGNTAPFGSVVYGSTLETCEWSVELLTSGNYSNMTLYEVLYNNYRNIFNFDKEPSTVNQVATDSHRVQVSNSQSGPVNVTPGETFLVDVVTLDRLSRETPSVLSSKIDSDTANTLNITSALGLSGYWFTAGNSQTPVTVYGDKSLDNINITLFTTDSSAQTDITINLLNCTSGFILENSSCICDQTIEFRHQYYCNSTSKELTVDDNVWVGYELRTQSLIATACVLDYCKSGLKKFRPPDFNSQCRTDYNRAGVACAQCEDGYSTAFGTNRCLNCSYSTLYWIPVLGVVGLVIIFLLCFFRIGISDGYLLSVVFYVNVVSLYTPSFSNGSHDVFILTAWLNLDLGISTCFYDGMDAVARAGLQLVFPAYLYALMISIVILARRSRRFCALLTASGHSTPKLFATLLLMTHANLSRTCVEILGFTRSITASGELVYQWNRDPNVPYFHPSRIPLVIIAIALLLFYIIPAPLLLIVPQISQKLLFQKFVPIYDAFWAPFKPRYRFWVGLRLLLRGFPICFVYFFTETLQVTFLGIFLLILTYIQVIALPFKTTMINAVDLFFQYNISLLVVLNLCYASLIANASSGDVHRLHNIESATFLVIAITAYVVVIGVFVWHVFNRFLKLKVQFQTLWKQAQDQVFLKKKDGVSSEADEGTTPRSHFRRSEVCSYTLREPMLQEGELSFLEVIQGRDD